MHEDDDLFQLLRGGGQSQGASASSSAHGARASSGRGRSRGARASGRGRSRGAIQDLGVDADDEDADLVTALVARQAPRVRENFANRSAAHIEHARNCLAVQRAEAKAAREAGEKRKYQNDVETLIAVAPSLAPLVGKKGAKA